jgi:acetyl-CoA acyltransferase
LDLAKAVVAELVARTDLDPTLIDRVVYGQVVCSPDVPNIAREVVLGAGLPRHIDAYSVSRACATSTQALADAAQAIMLGDIDIALCGGADSLSRPPITYSTGFVDVLMAANAAKDPLQKARAFLDLKPKDFLPKPPALKELSTGFTMGQSAEAMAKENRIPREEQDAFALQSHQAAHRAWESGVFKDEVMTIRVGHHLEKAITQDTFVRSDASLEKMASLKPAFDKNYGSVTAGNSSPLTDGASALLLMEESKALALGFEPLAFVKAWAFAAVDPSWQLLMGPALAIPKVLRKAGLHLQDMDFIDMHEAFAAQVLSNIQALESTAFARERLGQEEAVGVVDRSRLNVYGGSISMGHPFAATGARQVHTMARALQRRGGGRALISQCAAGGLGAAVVLER